MRSITKANVKGKRVIVRVDFNVPLKDGLVQNDARIRATLPTINALLEKGASVVLMTHLGRPDGKIVDTLRLKPVALHLAKLLGKKVLYVPAVIGAPCERVASRLREGDVMLVENLRFDPREEKNDKTFAKYLAKLGDLYCNDAFGVSHRAHASVAAITKFLPSFAGPLLEKEVALLSVLTRKPKKPFVAILGGAKVGDKIQLIAELSKRCDAILIGGAMTFTFLLACGKNIGKSKAEPDKVALARKLLKRKNIILPTDIVLDNGKTVSVNDIPANARGLDIGEETQAVYAEIIRGAKTVFWNGPLGLFEQKPYHLGTLAIAKAISKAKAISIVGGGDSIAAIELLKLQKAFTHLSTGGGASLEFIQGKKLPGITALD